MRNTWRLTETMPAAVRRELERAMDQDIGVVAREQSLIGERLAGMSPLDADGAFSTALKANARWFAWKILARVAWALDGAGAIPAR